MHDHVRRSRQNHPLFRVANHRRQDSQRMVMPPAEKSNRDVKRRSYSIEAFLEVCRFLLLQMVDRHIPAMPVRDGPERVEIADDRSGL